MSRGTEWLGLVLGLSLIVGLGCESESAAPPANVLATEEGAAGGGAEGGGSDATVEDEDAELVTDSEESGEEGADVVEQESCTVEIAGCTTLICPSNDDFNTVQDALIQAAPGDVVCLGSGTFRLGGRLTIATGGVVVRGAGQGVTVLDYSKQSAGTKAFLVKSHGVTLEDMTIVNYIQDGIVFENANDWTVGGVEVTREWTNELTPGDALRAVGGKRGRVEWSENITVPGEGENGEALEIGVSSIFSGSYGPGIHLRGTTQALVRGNPVIQGNSLGILLVSAVDTEIRDANIRNNGAGVLIASAVNGGLGKSARVRVQNSVIAENNLGEDVFPGPSEEGGLPESSWAPAGTGVAVIAAEDTHILENSIQQNNGYAVFLLTHREDYGFPMPEGGTVAPYVTGTYVSNNSFAANGSKPLGISKTFPASPPVPAMATDGCRDESVPESAETRNCFMNNMEAGLRGQESSSASFVFFDACNGYTQIAFEPEDALAACEHAALAPIDQEQAEDCENGIDDDDDGAIDCEDGDCFLDPVCEGRAGNEGAGLAGGDNAEEAGGDNAEEAGGDNAEEAGGDNAEEAGGDNAEEAGGDNAEEAGGDNAEEAGGDNAEDAGGDNAEEGEDA